MMRKNPVPQPAQMQMKTEADPGPQPERWQGDPVPGTQPERLRRRRGEEPQAQVSQMAYIPTAEGRFEMGDALFLNFGIIAALMLTIALPERSAVVSQNLHYRLFDSATQSSKDFRHYVIEVLEGSDGDLGQYQQDQLEFNISVGRGKWVDTRSVFLGEWNVSSVAVQKLATRWLFEHFPVAKMHIFYQYNADLDDVRVAREWARRPEVLLSWSTACLMAVVILSLMCIIFWHLSPTKYSQRSFQAFWDGGGFFLLLLMVLLLIAGIIVFFAGANRVYDDSPFSVNNKVVDETPWMFFFLPCICAGSTLAIFAFVRSFRHYPFSTEGFGLKLPDELEHLVFSKPGVRVILEAGDVGGEALVSREHAVSLRREDVEEVPEELEARGVSPETWRHWMGRLEGIAEKGSAWYGVRLAHFVCCLFLCPVFCLCNYLGFPNAEKDPYQQAFKAWMAAFNAEVLERKGIYLKAFTFKQMSQGKHDQVGRSLSVLAFALTPEEAARFKTLRAMQDGLVNTAWEYALCSYAGSKRAV